MTQQLPMGREVPLALSDTETTYVTMYLEAYVNDPKGAVVALDPPQILAALQLIGRRVREKEIEFWAACEAQQKDDPTFHLGPLAYVEKRAKEIELETDYWFSDHVKERKAAQAAQIAKIQARTEEARSRKVQRDEFLASTQTASSVLNSTSVLDRDDFLRTAGCNDEEIDDVELAISNHVRVLAEQWRSEQNEYIPVYGMVSVKAFGEGRDPHVATEGVVDLVNRTVRNASARISLAAEIAELQADKLRRRSAQDEIVPPTKSSRAGAKQSYEVVAGGTTTTGASRGISRVSKKPDRMTPHHKGRGGDSSTSSDGSDDSEHSALKERRKGKAAKVEPRTKDELLSIIRNEARGIHSPTRTDREIYARQLFNEMSPSDRQQYEAEAVKRTPARKPDAVSLKDRLAKWAAREKDGGTIAALVHHNMAGGGHLDPMTGGGDDFLDGERDTVAESDLGGRKRYYEPILDKGEHLARMTTSAQQKAWNLKGNAQRMMAAEQLRGPYGRGFGVYSAQRHQCLLAMLQHLAMDQFLYSRGLKVMNCDRELMAALLVILSALDPKKGKCDIPWEEIPRFETLLIDMHAMAELLCSKRMVPWTLGMIVVTLTATPVEWAELDANFRPSMVKSYLRTRKGPHEDPWMEYDGTPESEVRVRETMAPGVGGPGTLARTSTTPIAGGYGTPRGATDEQSGGVAAGGRNNAGGGNNRGGGGRGGGGGGGGGGGSGGGGSGGGGGGRGGGAPNPNPGPRGPLGDNQCANCRNVGHKGPACPYVCVKCKPNTDGHRRKHCPN